VLLPLNQSDNAKYKIIKSVPNIEVAVLWDKLDEESIFNNDDTAIFEGTITKITNYKVNFGKSISEGLWTYAEYMAVVTIKVDEVLKGELSNNDEVSAIISFPISEKFLIDKTSLATLLKVGAKGIFTPRKLKETDYFEENGKKLHLLDLADYSLDSYGLRYAFMNEDNGVFFDGSTNSTLNEGEKTLSDITDYAEAKKYIVEKYASPKLQDLVVKESGTGEITKITTGEIAKKYKYNIYYYGLKNVDVKFTNKTIDLKEAL